MKSSDHPTATTDHPTATTEVAEKPKSAWSKPTIRVMTVSFTQDGQGNNMGAEDPDGGSRYIPPTS